MTLSRIATILIAAALPASAEAQSVTAEEALANHARTVASAGATDCRDQGALDPEEVVVCGRRTGPSLRLPLPVESEPGMRINGEPVSASVGLQPQRCTAWGPNQSCGGGLPILPMAIAAVKGAVKIVDAVVNPD